MSFRFKQLYIFINHYLTRIACAMSSRLTSLNISSSLTERCGRGTDRLQDDWRCESFDGSAQFTSISLAVLITIFNYAI